MSYIDDQNAKGLKVGDNVKILRTAKTQEGGWTSGWLSDMDKAVGQTGKIISIDGSGGIRVQLPSPITCYWYPYFILEKVEEKKKFIVGDKVRILCTDRVSVANMEKYIGEVGKITRTSDISSVVHFDDGFEFVWQNTSLLPIPYGPITPIIKNSHWNCKCSICGADAYQGLLSVECSNGCK